MQRIIIIISICFIGSVLTIILLIQLSENLVHRPNSFLRVFPLHPIMVANTLDIKYNSYYIAGTTRNHVYLGNQTAPLHLLTLNSILTDTQHVKLNVKNINNVKFWSVKVKVDSPNFYVTDGGVPRIFSGKINDWKAEREMYDSAYFVDSIPINTHSYVIRSLSSLTKEYVLAKEMLTEPHIVLKPGILEKQVDGQFCMDGMMHYDKKTERVIYIYFYRNQYIVMDTNLNILYRDRTIDTISRAKIKIASVKSNGSNTMATPPLLVNKRSCVFGNWLFINSDLMAKNEIQDDFDKVSVIDVYSLKSREYKFSFYLSHFTEKKLKDFYVFDNKLVALFDHYVVIYDLVQKYFQD